MRRPSAEGRWRGAAAERDEQSEIKEGKFVAPVSNPRPLGLADITN